MISFVKTYILPLREKEKRRKSRIKTLDFDTQYLATSLHKELLAIYKHYWPNEISCQTQKKYISKEDARQVFAQESYQNMTRFCRQFGLSEVVVVSNSDKVNKIWHSIINKQDFQ